ncbi:uncharacterized protein LOC121741471 isoform X1 [Salvia splendens]|uniref:uncharacterized protein LOC121741471 isoform X1 n=1 Tax=Salvia splendens TaxID=180675 RepID=UPI001C260F85|nr:uncharacterized protein LOC121741471 isoform X1 [Salvia splendens]
MILDCGVVALQWRPRRSIKTLCNSASPSLTAEQLRQQLDTLHKEADTTRIKASNARLRLIRLSEAVEKIRRQAAVSVQTGKENEARELLFQKKKIMQAMEKLKTRIELFDQFSVKLNELGLKKKIKFQAISMKESLLIGNMTLDLEVSESEPSSPVRIVSPTEENITDDDLQLDSDNMEFEEDQEMQVSSENQRTTHSENGCNSLEDSVSEKMLNDADDVRDPRESSTYEDFVTHIDQQLKKIQEELETFVRVSNLFLESKERPEYSKVQHATEILEGVYHIRERIAITKQTK